MVKKIMEGIISGTFICDTEKNTECRKTHCAKTGGECECTTNRNFAKYEEVDE